MPDDSNIDEMIQNILADMPLKEKAAVVNVDKDKVPCGYDLGMMNVRL